MQLSSELSVQLGGSNCSVQTSKIGIEKMSEKKNESVTDKKISRRSMLKWTGALAAAVAVGVGAGYGADNLLRPVTTITEREATTVTQPLVEEQVLTTTTIGGPLYVHVRNGRITWIEPLKYTEKDATPWWMSENGLWKPGNKRFTPPMGISLSQHTMALRRKVYSPQRTRYPMKRVDWDPNGDRHPETRGKSEYVRITWEEAYDIMTKEIQRMKDKYGNSAILSWS
jgi:anaerobic selenocysteine-containing dehydrogenase